MPSNSRRAPLIAASLAVLATTACAAVVESGTPAVARTSAAAASTVPHSTAPDARSTAALQGVVTSAEPADSVTESASPTVTASPSARTAGARLTGRPNIVFITTDDQTLWEMRWMPRTRRLLGGGGVRFTEGLAPHPLCCPARAIMLTGQYAHNNGVRHNEGRYGGFQRLRSTHTVPVWLDRAGYNTAFVGKYLNGYTADDGREPGWDVWNPTVKAVYAYYGYTMYDDGRLRQYQNIHNSDLVGAKTVDYIRRFSDSGRPFFIWASHTSPHGSCLPQDELSCWKPAIPAERHAGLFRDAALPTARKPSFNEANLSDKPRWVRRTEQATKKEITFEFRQRIRSLQAVDEAVGRTVRALRDAGELDNTLIVFTSDNGYLLGEHGLTFKNVAYEEALRVPFLVRGPGIPAGQKRRQVVTAIDFAPTFLDAAKADASVAIDGRSFLPAARGRAVDGYDTVLVQSGPLNRIQVRFGWAYRGVRTHRYTYVSWPATGETELYDNKLDPYQLDNISGARAYARVEAQLKRRLRTLKHCSGSECRARFGALPRPGS
jgi:N-acetylglucosamine-6-sulfatase